MSASAISIEVGSEAARAYAGASEELKRKIGLLFRMNLQEMLDPRRSLTEIMDSLSAQAKANGLTPETLESILNDG